MTATLPQRRTVSGPLATAAVAGARWRYAGGKRDARLDLMRGFAAFGMVVDHIGGGGSWLYALTGGNRFFISAAEVFVFISGLVMGIVYRDIIVRRGMKAAAGKILKRAWTLYVLTVLLTLSFAALSWLLRLPWTPDIAPREVPAWVVGVVTLHQTYNLTDIPLLYTFLVLGAIPVLLLLVQGKAAWALAGSWGLWALWQAAPAAAMLPWEVADNTTFFFPAWQVLFVTALVLGFHRDRVGAWAGRLPLGSTVAVSGTAFVLMVVLYFAGPGDLHHGGATSGFWFAKEDVGPGRIAAFAVGAVFSYALLTLVWAPVRLLTGWLLLPLGHHALTAYSLHIFVVAFFHRGREWWTGEHADGLVSTGLQLAGLAGVWAVIVLWPALAGWADTCRHCLVLHRHGAAHPLPVRLRGLIRERGESHERAAGRTDGPAVAGDAVAAAGAGGWTESLPTDAERGTGERYTGRHDPAAAPGAHA